MSLLIKWHVVPCHVLLGNQPRVLNEIETCVCAVSTRLIVNAPFGDAYENIGIDTEKISMAPAQG